MFPTLLYFLQWIVRLDFLLSFSRIIIIGRIMLNEGVNHV